MSIIPPPHPRSSSQPPPLLRLADVAQAKAGEEDPAGEEPTLVRLPRLQDFATEDVELTPVRHDYPPADVQAYRRSIPAIPPPPLKEYASWPPTVLEAREAMASWPTNLLSLGRQVLEFLRTWSERALWEARGVAERAQAFVLEHWPKSSEPPADWLRARIPYALGMVVVLVLAVVLWPASPSDSGPAASMPVKIGNAATSSSVTTSAATTKKPPQSASQNSSQSSSLGSSLARGQRPASSRLSTEATLLVALAESLMDAGRDAEAVPVLERALARTPGIANDPTFLRVMKLGALSQDPITAAQIHALLIGPMGERGAEVLYEISTSRTARKGVRDRANAFVYTKDFEHKAPLPLYAAFKLLTAPTCEAKKSLLAFAAEAGGRHALDYLRELDEHKICSLDDFDNCYPCMNLDDTLPQAIEKIEKRLGT